MGPSFSMLIWVFSDESDCMAGQVEAKTAQSVCDIQLI